MRASVSLFAAVICSSISNVPKARGSPPARRCPPGRVQCRAAPPGPPSTIAGEESARVARADHSVLMDLNCPIRTFHRPAAFQFISGILAYRERCRIRPRDMGMEDVYPQRDRQGVRADTPCSKFTMSPNLPSSSRRRGSILRSCPPPERRRKDVSVHHPPTPRL